MAETDTAPSSAATRMLPLVAGPIGAGLAIVETKLADFDAGAKAVLKSTICPGYSDEELRLFATYCARTGLDPFSRQILSWKDKNGRLVFHVGIDGFRVIAERSGKYDGQETALEFLKEANGANGSLIAATVRVYRKDFRNPVSATAYWDEYAPKEVLPGSAWARMPTVMLAKCAEALALRKTFPNDLSGIYEPAEMDGAPKKD